MDLKPGLYEQVIDERLRKAIELLPGRLLREQVQDLDVEESHEILASYLAGEIARYLRTLPADQRLSHQLEACNRILGELRDMRADSPDPDLQLVQAQQLLAVLRDDPAVRMEPIRPGISLARNGLITGSRQDPNFLSQLRAELETADSVDILCSFIKWSGVCLLQDALTQFSRRDGVQVRVVTTPYMGATDLRAVEVLSKIPGVEVRVSYDTRRTRLHAKAYLFHRATGFGSAYIGSSNLSTAAVTDGLEWNVKISQHESGYLWEKIAGSFETYWNDPEFVLYGEETRDNLALALQAARSGVTDSTPHFAFSIQPYSFQSEILERLQVEREVHDRWRNLVVAATGTGKTVIAAFDFQRFLKNQQSRRSHARLLFVAHRQEILEQALACFRGILRDQNFGELLTGNHSLTQRDHVFATIQSCVSQGLLQRISRDFYDYVVIDEVHHAPARSYRALIETLAPKILLGLTATPERADGVSVLADFDDHIAAELRLPDAISRGLLCPFHYFGVSDRVDLSRLQWQRGGYAIAELDALYSSNIERAADVADALRKYVLDVQGVRGLGFCVSIQHARFMAECFNRFGIASEVLTGDSTEEERSSVRSKLESREINFVFVVDLYNEGVDIPNIDTVLFLRPTESLTVFLQQLGRGLRLAADKTHLTVLDFVGQAHQNFRFDLRFEALLGRTSGSLQAEIEQGCPHAPPGCAIHLEKQASAYILNNIRSALKWNLSTLRRQIRELARELQRTPTFAEYLERYGGDIERLYRQGCWARHCVEAGIAPEYRSSDDPEPDPTFKKLLHLDSADYLKRLLELLELHPSEMDTLPEVDRRWLLMLNFTLWPRKLWKSSLTAILETLRRVPVLFEELKELLKYQLAHTTHRTFSAELPFVLPIQCHASYSRDELLAGTGHWSLERAPEMREGVLFVPSLPADILLVTLKKTEKEFSPTTLYEDYAISETLFHWQSQSTTSAESPTGQRYIHHKDSDHTILLFVREQKIRSGEPCPYTFLGPVDYVSHSGSRPVSIVWKLRYAMPAWLAPSAMKLAVG